MTDPARRTGSPLTRLDEGIVDQSVTDPQHHAVDFVRECLQAQREVLDDLMEDPDRGVYRLGSVKGRVQLDALVRDMHDINVRHLELLTQLQRERTIP